jgi:pimeloyl-ACP methyl ester carboxylesterase
MVILALQTSTDYARRFSRSWVLLLAALVVFAGCGRQRYVSVRKTPQNPFESPVRLVTSSGPKPTPRTELLLRRFDLADAQENQPGVVLASLKTQLASEPTPDKIYSYAELAYLHANQLQDQSRTKEAMDQFAASVAHAYWYLFDPGLDRFRNPYDPQFRRACDIYNSALEGALRIVNQQKQLRPGQRQVLVTGRQEFVVDIAIRGPWRAEELERLEFVNDYEIEGGLTNRHHYYGLGVPLIAVRGRRPNDSPAERFYPPGLSFAVTAFLRVASDAPTGSSGEKGEKETHHCVLELYDPLTSADVQVCNRLVPLEADLSTPLAFFLDDPAFQQTDTSTLGLLDPTRGESLTGLFMVEPYDPERIPVVMVHGLWSSPTTWMEMFNDLRAYPDIRKRYQFWFYQYPTGQPFWISAAQMRDKLAEARMTLDPEDANPNLKQMVLVGHSMGGLVSKLQTLDSGDAFWRILTDKPIEELQATESDRSRLAKSFYFQANSNVKRVVTIGSPHRGSDFANDYTRYLTRSLITLPQMMTDLTNKVARENPGYFRDTNLLTLATGVDSLAPGCPIFSVLQSAEKPNWVTYHNIYGLQTVNKSFAARFQAPGDGIVTAENAQLNGAATQIAVDADHLTVHRHPLTVLEVRRILREHGGIQSEYQPSRAPWLQTLQPPLPAPAAPAIPAGAFPLPATAAMHYPAPPPVPDGFVAPR